MLNTRVWSQATAITIKSVSRRWRVWTISTSTPMRGSPVTTGGAMTGRDRFGFRELLVELLLEVAQAREVLIESLLVPRSDRLLHRLGLHPAITDSTLRRTITRGFGLKRRRVRVLEIDTEQSGVELERRNLRRIGRVLVLVADRIAEVAGRGSGQRA